MNEEIKEILESLDKIAKAEYYPEDLLTYKECQLLLDYITNLLEEYERLKERCDYLQRSCDRKEEQRDDARMEYMEQEDYKTRCESLLEKINFYKTTEWGLRSYAILDLFENILNGGNDK